MPSDRDLPEYKSPPVIEVVAGIQFEPLPVMAVHYGEFWQRIKAGYPKSQDLVPLDSVLELEKGTQVASIVASDVPPLRRIFFIDSSDNYLYQLQPTRFLSNWRKVRPEDEYPRFTAAQERFLRGWEEFLAFARDQGWPPPKVNQYELTYVNHIAPLEGHDTFPTGIQDVVPMFAWKSGQSEKFLPPPTVVNSRLVFTLPDGKGRLHVTMGQAIRGGKRVVVLDLTARGPARADWSDRAEWFSVARRWIVRGFTDLTSPVAHSAWGRTR